jgi:hypothetical protein
VNRLICIILMLTISSIKADEFFHLDFDLNTSLDFNIEYLVDESTKRVRGVLKYRRKDIKKKNGSLQDQTHGKGFQKNKSVNSMSSLKRARVIFGQVNFHVTTLSLI